MFSEIRLFVVESSAMFSGRLAALVCSQEEVRLLGRAKVYQLTYERIHSASPDVMLVDTGMAVAENLPVVRRIREQHPRLPQVVGVLEQGADAVVEYFLSGANACIQAEVSAPDALAALHCAQQGKIACSPIVLRILFHRLRETSPIAVSQQTRLSSREKEVLRLIADGLLNKQIANRLGIALCTVKNHIHNILQKLQVCHRRDAIDYAYRTGILRGSAREGKHPNTVDSRFACVLPCERHFS